MTTSFLTSTIIFSLCLTITSTFFITNQAKFSHQYPNTNPISTHNNNITHLHFYFHHIIIGKNHTVKPIFAYPKNASRTTMIMDSPLTKVLKPQSKIVGRAQGVYVMASQHGSSSMVVMNLSFKEGKYNGSTLNVLGKNPVPRTVKEMPVIGGSGVFMLVRGYALAKAVWYNETSGDAIAEYNVFVRHG